MKKPSFINNQIYHIYNRGVEKRDIFLNDEDLMRFVHNLYEFNDEKPALNIYYKSPERQSYEVQLRKEQPRKLIVDILAFCLIKNHFHLLLQQRAEKGIVTFMQKLGTGYTNYFNKKYERVGSLFQGRFKAVLIKQESHFIHIPYYIHANPLTEQQDKKQSNHKNSLDFLDSYRWSSHMDYIGEDNFPSVTQREFLLKFFGSQEQYKKNFADWIKIGNFNNIKDVIIDD